MMCLLRQESSRDQKGWLIVYSVGFDSFHPFPGANKDQAGANKIGLGLAPYI